MQKDSWFDKIMMKIYLYSEFGESNYSELLNDLE